MRNSYKKICALIAASGFKEREIVDFVETLHRTGPYEFIDTILRTKNLIEETVEYGLGGDLKHSNSFENSYDTANKITRLLIQEAKLPKTAAIQLLTTALLNRYPNQIIPNESRKGFENWIRKLIDITSESELLHIATKIRNDYVHESPSAWRLR